MALEVTPLASFSKDQDLRCSPQGVRRSARDPSKGLLDNPDIQHCLEKLRQNHESTQVFKLKDHVRAELTELVMDEILNALSKNKLCEALYIQNVSDALCERQFNKLIEILRMKRIWALNIGENYNITPAMWGKFCEILPDTHLTHIYVSEHVITTKMKDKIRDLIRENRKKHSKHNSVSNIDVIQRCTNLWWNPINALRRAAERKLLEQVFKRGKASLDGLTKTQLAKVEHLEKKRNEGAKAQLLLKKAREDAQKKREALRLKKMSALERRKEQKKLKQQRARVNNARNKVMAKKAPDSIEYWALGSGAAEEWYFECKCGETCSWWENFRYHPTGRQYQCSHCRNWLHVRCMFGDKIRDEDMDEIEDALCFSCQGKVRRMASRPELYVEEGSMSFEEIALLGEKACKGPGTRFS